MKYKLVLLILLITILCPSPVRSEKIGFLLVIGRKEKDQVLPIQKVIDWKTKQGFEVWSVTEDQFQDSIQFKNYLKDFYSKHPNLQYAILPPLSFFGKVQYTIDKVNYESISETYFENLDDDPLFRPEIMIGRATIHELNEIIQRKNMLSITANIGFPMLNYKRWGCIPGECLAYLGCDPSPLANEMKKQFQKNHYEAFTFLEQEGIKPSSIQPDFALNQANIANQLAQSNIVWYLNTLEPLQPQPEGYVFYSTHNQFIRAIWKRDTNGDSYITDPELDLMPFFVFSTEKTIWNRIGFLPLFDNEKINLNQFSSVIGIQPVDGCMFVPQEGDGSSHSVLALYRMVMENLISGKTAGQSIQVFSDYLNQFPVDPYQQQYFSLGLFIRGDPTLSLPVLLDKAKLEILPTEIEKTSTITIPMNQLEVEFIIRNSGSSPMPFSLEYDKKLLTISPFESIVEPGQQQVVKISILRKRNWIQKINLRSTPKKKSSVMKIQTNPAQKLLQIIWYSP